MPGMIPTEACRRTVELLFSTALHGFPHFPVTQINCAGNCFARLNQNSDVFQATKLAKACNLSEPTFHCSDFERQLYTASTCLHNNSKVHSEAFTSQLHSPHNLTACFNLHSPVFAPQPRLWVKCHRGNKLRVPSSSSAPHSVHPKIEALTLPLLPFVWLPPLQSLISWDVALATGGIFNAQCVVD